MLLMLIMTLTILQGNAQCIYRMDFDRSYNLPPEGGMMNVMLFGDYNAVESAGYEIRYSNGTRDRGSAGVENGIVSIMVYPYNGPTDYNARITVSVYSYSRPECNYEETLYFSHQGVPSFTPGTIGSNQTIPSDTQPARLINTASGSSGVSYRWQQSLNGYSFTDITGATAVDYQPPVLNATTYYRRQATFSGYAKYSNTVTVTVTVDPSSFSPSNENYIITFSPIYSSNHR